MESVSHEVIHQVDVQGQKMMQGTRKYIEEGKEKRQQQQSQSKPAHEAVQTQQLATPTVQETPVSYSYPETVSQRVSQTASDAIRERE